MNGVQKDAIEPVAVSAVGVELVIVELKLVVRHFDNSVETQEVAQAA